MKIHNLQVNHKERGFTLIELMIVVAIIGILAAVAIPAYNDYTIKVRFTEVMQASAAVKVGLSEEYLITDSFPAAADAIVTDMSNQFVNSDYVANAAAVVYAAGNPATFTVTLSNIGANANNATVVYSFSGSASGVDMSCNGGSLLAKYRPAECR